MGAEREMTADTSREFERIHWLFHEFRDAINRGGVGPRTAVDAVEYTLEDLLAACATAKKSSKSISRPCKTERSKHGSGNGQLDPHKCKARRRGRAGRRPRP
jgi:hypothetical protein